MIFDFRYLKSGVMKGLLYLIAGLLIFSGCAVNKDAMTARQEKKKLQKAAEIAIVRKAVESRQYIIRMDKIYIPGGTWADLVPKNNFLIIDGELATVSLGYIGRYFGTRPISGINFRGSTVDYKLISDQGKGTYNIQVEISRYNDRFDFFITIGASGYCSVTINNNYIQSVNYKGTLVPITRLAENRQNNNIRL